jgi:hypothetical protein
MQGYLQIGIQFCFVNIHTDIFPWLVESSSFGSSLQTLEDSSLWMIKILLCKQDSNHIFNNK